MEEDFSGDLSSISLHLRLSLLLEQWTSFSTIYEDYIKLQ